MKTISAFGGGLAGAVAVSLIHESVKRIVPQAPRMDLLGMDAISKGLDKVGISKPAHDSLFVWALAGDVISNSLYYSLAGIGKEKNVWVRSSLLGLAAGVGAVLLPGPLGLKERHSNRTLTTKIMTVGLYVTGALVTAAVIKLFEKKKQKREEVWEERLLTSAIS
ncbi:MAG: hypothetical protein ACXWV0_00450 [Flavisolibacter sp.]